MCPRTGMQWDSTKLKNETVRLGDDLRGKLDLEIADIGVAGSRFWKTVYRNPSRLGPQVKEEQVNDNIE